MKKDSFAKAIESMEDEYLLDAIGFKAPKRIRAKHLMIAAAAALILIAASLFTFLALRKNPANENEAATIYLEGEVGFSFVVSEDRTVLRAEALDPSAIPILDGRSCVGIPIHDAVGMVASAMIEENFLSAKEDALLLTIDAPEEIAKPLSEDIEKALRSTASKKQADSPVLVLMKNPVVTVSGSRAEELAERWHISVRKAELISCIVDADGDYTYETLVGTSISRLGAICRKLNLEIAKLSERAAIQIALTSVGLNESDADILQSNCSSAYWVIGFYCGNQTYLFRIDAFTGQVLQSSEKACLNKDEIVRIVIDYCSENNKEYMECTIIGNEGETAIARVVFSDSARFFVIDRDTRKVVNVF